MAADELSGERVRLRRVLDVSHGQPVHDRAEFERALERAPWED